MSGAGAPVRSAGGLSTSDAAVAATSAVADLAPSVWLIDMEGSSDCSGAAGLTASVSKDVPLGGCTLGSCGNAAFPGRDFGNGAIFGPNGGIELCGG